MRRSVSRGKNILGATIMTYKETRVFRANVANFNACEKRNESYSLFFFSDDNPIPDPCVRACGFIERERKDRTFITKQSRRVK